MIIIYYIITNSDVTLLGMNVSYVYCCFFFFVPLLVSAACATLFSSLLVILPMTVRTRQLQFHCTSSSPALWVTQLQALNAFGSDTAGLLIHHRHEVWPGDLAALLAEHVAMELYVCMYVCILGMSALTR